MKKELLDALLHHDMDSVVKHMVLPQKDFLGKEYPYGFNFNEDANAIDKENLLIRLNVWMNNVLEFDDITDTVNVNIQDYEEKYGGIYGWEVPEILIEDYDLGHLDIEKEYDGYTYNNPDYFALERDVLYTIVTIQEDYYVLINVHYGADARTGFGDTAIFRIQDYDYFHSSMTITGHTHGGQHYEFWEISQKAEYDNEKGEWVDLTTGEEIKLYSPADGF